MKPIYTQTYIFNIHETQVSQTPHQIHHSACKSSTFMEYYVYFRHGKYPTFSKTAENRRETNRIVY